MNGGKIVGSKKQLWILLIPYAALIGGFFGIFLIIKDFYNSLE